MKAIKVDCTFEERTSKEGNTYKALVIRLADNYDKIVFLTVPEQVLLENTYKEQNETFDNFKY